MKTAETTPKRARPSGARRRAGATPPAGGRRPRGRPRCRRRRSPACPCDAGWRPPLPPRGRSPWPAAPSRPSPLAPACDIRRRRRIDARCAPVSPIRSRRERLVDREHAAAVRNRAQLRENTRGRRRCSQPWLTDRPASRRLGRRRRGRGTGVGAGRAGPDRGGARRALPHLNRFPARVDVSCRRVVIPRGTTLVASVKRSTALAVCLVGADPGGDRRLIPPPQQCGELLNSASSYPSLTKLRSCFEVPPIPLESG